MGCTLLCPVMRSRWVLPVLGWCAATLASVALASVALLPVLRTGTPSTGDTAAEFAAGPVIAGPGGATPTSVAVPPDAGSPAASSGAASSRPPSSASRSPKASPTSQPVRVVDGWTVLLAQRGDLDGAVEHLRLGAADGDDLAAQALRDLDG